MWWRSRQGRGESGGFLQIPRFPGDPELCPVRALITYFNKVTSLFVLIQVFKLVLAGVTFSSGSGVFFRGPRQASRLRFQPDPRQVDEDPPDQRWD